MRVFVRSFHPYIFFNQDMVSITLVGFKVTKNGDLLDPATEKVIEPGIMKPQLYAGLDRNIDDFKKDYRGWNKIQMIEKIAKVMGIEYNKNPDDTYVLTIDNLIKIMAIQMRFR